MPYFPAIRAKQDLTFIGIWGAHQAWHRQPPFRQKYGGARKGWDLKGATRWGKTNR